MSGEVSPACVTQLQVGSRHGVTLLRLGPGDVDDLESEAGYHQDLTYHLETLRSEAR